MKFELSKKAKSKDSITRTIRFSGESYDEIEKLAEENDISFNNVVNQMVKYTLENMK